MSAAEVEWEPGMPLMPDNGCGNIPPTPMAPDERAAIIAEGDPPPWWRPEPEPHPAGSTRSCEPCDVRWFGDDTCWMCGQVPA